MHIFIELPTWLGDSVMTTPSIESLVMDRELKLTLFGTPNALSIYQHHPHVIHTITDTRSGNRVLSIRSIAQSLTEFDYALSFRSSLISKWLLYNLRAKQKKQYKRLHTPNHQAYHQVYRYYDFINQACNLQTPIQPLHIYTGHPIHKPTKALGINPGATYGSAKRYYPQKFAEVINAVASQFDTVLIFGSTLEVDIALDIMHYTTAPNVTNLAGTLSIDELITTIATLDTFITADSGPMHIASSFGIKTIALFGATDDSETVGWDDNTQVVKQHREILACMPCKKRTCPLGHHKCMANITPSQIINLLQK